MKISATRAIMISALLMLGFGSALAQPNTGTDEPQIQYVGGITLCAANPKTLAQWYTEKFGLRIDNSSDGIYWGSVKYKDMEMDIGIHPASDDCRRSEQGTVITFHVDNYARYVDKLNSKGIVPIPGSTVDGGEYGKFAYFFDLENNKIAIWGK